MTDLLTQLRDYGLQIESDSMLDATRPGTVEVGARPPQRRLGRGPAWAVAAFAIVLSVGGLYFALSGGDGQVVDQTVPTSTPVFEPIAGTWVTTDADGSTPTMTVQVSEGGVVEIVVVDDVASVCSGTPSTMTGTGRLDGDTRLVIPAPVLACDDGTQAEALSGPPLEEQLQNFAFTHDPATDTLTDSLGSSWSREGAEPPSPDPTVVSGMWPQSSLEEVEEAQQLADAGDPAYTWQLDSTLAANGEPWDAEIFARFMQDELGWEEFSAGNNGFAYGDGGGLYEEVVFIRCAPGETNPLSSLYADVPAEIRGCAPTIDDLRYETVRFRATQPGRRGPDGIWVVDQWEMNQPADQGSLWGLLYPDFAFSQVEQVVPPSDAEVAAFLEEFLRARVDGVGAEQYLLREPEESPFLDKEVPILYATTSGAAYERSEIEKVQGPVWPTGWSEYKVRLFAEDGTVVEQYFYVVPQENGELGLVYGYKYDGLPTTENGQSVPLPYSIHDGEVTFAAAPPWVTSDTSEPSDTLIRLNGSRDDHVVIATDPLPAMTDCEIASAPTDAEALARRIMADPNAETTGTVPVRIAGLDGLQMDVDVDMSAVVADGNYSCRWMWSPDQSDQWRMRLYLLDNPGGSAPVLAIAVIASPETDFERVLEEVTPIVESLEIHTR